MSVLSTSPNTNDACLQICITCLQACKECLTACLNEPDVQARINCIRTLNDCAEICSLAIHYMASNSTFAPALCRVCAEVCEACAKHCEMFQDAHCQECAKICHQCAEECRKMSA